MKLKIEARDLEQAKEILHSLKSFCFDDVQVSYDKEQNATTTQTDINNRPPVF